MYASNSEPVVMGAAVTPPAAPPVPTAAPVVAPPVVATTEPAPAAPKAPASIESPRVVPRQIEYVGTLSIDASPGGDVFVDRQRAGHTPVRMENLKAGSHLIWVERDGYRRWTKVVEVPADRISRAFADLEPLAAR
jgi:hypothetical protein